jgi:hypothetical protein
MSHENKVYVKPTLEGNVPMGTQINGVQKYTLSDGGSHVGFYTMLDPINKNGN